MSGRSRNAPSRMSRGQKGAGRRRPSTRPRRRLQAEWSSVVGRGEEGIGDLPVAGVARVDVSHRVRPRSTRTAVPRSAAARSAGGRFLTTDEVTTPAIQEQLEKHVAGLVGRPLQVTHRWAGLFGLVLDFLARGRPRAGPARRVDRRWLLRSRQRARLHVRAPRGRRDPRAPGARGRTLRSVATA
jgi:hypothetical protein